MHSNLMKGKKSIAAMAAVAISAQGISNAFGMGK